MRSTPRVFSASQITGQLEISATRNQQSLDGLFGGSINRDQELAFANLKAVQKSRVGSCLDTSTLWHRPPTHKGQRSIPFLRFVDLTGPQQLPQLHSG